MNKKIRGAFVNVIVLLLSLTIIILITEVALRVFSGEPGEDEWVGQDRRFYRYDPLLGWSKIPDINTIRVSVRGRNRVLYKINSKGIRGPEYPYSKRPGEYRILILGDSFADGYMIEFEDLFSEVMKRRLNGYEKFNNYVEVINTGVSGYSTDQELLFFQKEGKKYSPDLTILMFCENDVAYNNQPKDWGMNYKPLFKLKDGELVLTNVPVPKPDRFIYTEHLESKDVSILKKMRRWLHVHSYLYNLVKDRIKNSYALKSILISLHILNVSKKSTGKSFKDEWALPIEYRIWERKYNNTVIESWKITEAMIAKLKEEAESIGSGLLVFYIPFEASIYKEEWEKLKKKYGLSDEEWDIEKPGKVLEDICKKHDIDFINPTELFREKAKEIEKEGKRLYDPIDHHWTVEGNRFVGEILAEYVALNYLNGMKE